MPSSLRRNSLWLLLARLSAQALSILFIAVTARKLGLVEFGHFALIASVLLIGNTITNFGSDTFLIRDIARAGQVTQIASQALSLQLILSAVFCAALIFFRDPPLLLYNLALFPLAVFSVNTALLRALNRMDLFWFLTLANGTLQVLAAFFSSDVLTLSVFILMGNIILSAFSYFICRGSLLGFELIPLKDFRPIFRLTLPFAVLTIFLVLIQRLGILYVSAMLDDSATGLFSSAFRVVDGLKFGHYAILGALLPALSQGAPDSWRSFRSSFIFLMTVSAMFIALLIAASKPIIAILYGAEFVSAVPFLSQLGWTLLPYTVTSFISYSLIARRLEIPLAISAGVSLLFYAVLYPWLIHAGGVAGAVRAALLGEYLQSAVFVAVYLAYQKNSGVFLHEPK